MSVLIAIPAFDLEAERQEAFEVVRNHLDRLGWPVAVTVGPHAGAARNHAVAFAATDAIVFNDADTLVPLKQIRLAVQQVEGRGGADLAFAFTSYARVNYAATRTCADTQESGVMLDETFLIDLAVENGYETLFAPPSHGCVAVRRSAFEQVGGYDERLEAWEDAAFNARINSRRTVRVPGVAVHLWHPRIGDIGHPDFDERYAASRAIYQEEYE